MKHIMVIDDSPTIRTSVEFALNGLGMSMSQAENGSDALDKVKKIKSSGDEVALRDAFGRHHIGKNDGP